MLLVRAVSAEGVEGQASVLVEAVEPSHRVAEGETLASIAADYGLNPEVLLDLNPGIDPEGLSPGESLDLPGGESGSDPDTLGDGAPPDPLDRPPGSSLDVL